MLLAAFAISATLWAPAPPGLTATIGQVSCPQRQAPVIVVNDTAKPLSYELLEGDRPVRTERVPAGGEIDGVAQLAEDEPTDITVRSEGRVLAKKTLTANCDKDDDPTPPPNQGGNTPPHDRLPHTGSEGFARVLTAIGGLTGGAILLFWGWLWPGSGRGDWSSPVKRTFG